LATSSIASARDVITIATRVIIRETLRTAANLYDVIHKL